MGNIVYCAGTPLSGCLFVAKVQILCLCKCRHGSFDIITVLPPSAKQTIVLLLFCVSCRKKKDRCLCVRVFVCFCVHVSNKGK